MKKLLVTVIGATAAIGAFAGYPLRFNAFEVGSTTLNVLNADGNYWSAAADATNNTYAIKGDVSVGDTTLPIADSAPTQSLEVKTTFGKPLNVNLVAGGATTNINAGLYFDSLVKFTVCDSAPDTSSYDGAKIVLWLQEDEDNHVTNLWVRAGYLSSGAVVETNYLAGTEISDDFADKWHRVTIKSIADITTDYNVPGFAIWVDKNDGNGALSVACNDAKWAESFPYANALTEDAAYLNSYKALFPSMVQSGDYAQNLQTVGFDGTGEIADLVFTDVAPDYAKDYVASKVIVNDKEYTTFEEAVADIKSMTGTVSVQLLKGLTLDAPLVFEGEGEITLDFNGFVLNNDLAGAAITNSAASLTLTDSVGTGGISNSVADVEAICQTAFGAIAIAGGNYWADTAIMLEEGYTGDETFISGGKFADSMVGSYVVAGKKLSDTPVDGLYAVIEKSNWTVTFNSAGGSAVAAATVEDGVAVAEPTAPTKAHYTFAGWYNGNDAYNFSTPVTADLELTAHWTCIAKAQIGDNLYDTFAEALAAAVDGDTITLLGNVTAAKFTIAENTFATQGLTINLGGCTYTFTSGNAKDAIELLKGNKLTIANGTIAAEAGSTYRDVIRDYDSDLTLTNVTFNGANFPAADGEKLACLLCVEGGNVDIVGSTSFINVNAAYAIKMGNHAQSFYTMGTTTVNTTGNIMGNVLIAGGVYNEVAVGSGSTINYYYGKNVHSTWEDGVSSANFEARIGTLPTAAGTQDNVSGQLFKSLSAAVAAASANGTVTVLSDCTISTSLSIAKDLTVHNDYTITGAVNYAICIGAAVTFEGSGKIERASNISGSAFCVGANEDVRGTIAVGTAGTLNFNGGTVCGGNGGNLIKLENGTVNLNGGVLKDGKRGIKADADKGAYTSAIVINGGTITNNTDCAIMASAASADGTATVVVNGGVIAGALVYDGTAGTHSITIPGTSTAKFNADQSSFCATGYETVLSDGWYVVQAVAPAGEDIAPGGQSSTTYNTQADAEAAVANVTVEPDPAITNQLSAAAATAYAGMFEAKVVKADGDGYKIEVGLTAAAEAALQSVVDDAAAEVVADLTETDVELTTTPGFYYSFEYGTSLGNMAEGARTLATGSKLTLERPTTVGATSGFYKVLVNVTDKQ